MPQGEITSRANPWFRRFRTALELHREEIVLEGPKQIHDALSLGWAPLAIASNDARVSGEAIVLRFAPQLLAALSDTRSPQNSLALFRRPPESFDDLMAGPELIVVLDGVQDPGNAGTIVRLATAFDCSGVLFLEGSADPFSPKTIRASAGTILQIPVARCSRTELLDRAAHFQLELFAATAGGSTEFRLPRRGALVLGSEGQGVSVEIADASTKIGIRISPRVESLNVAAAAAILLANRYEGLAPESAQ